jgi:hypothetical protein
MNHTEDLKLSLQRFILHYTNYGVLQEALDPSLNIMDFSDPEMLDGEDLILAVKLLRRLL